MFEYSATFRAESLQIPPLPKKIISLVKESKVILDLWCGNGWLAHYKASDCSYIWISYSKADVEAIQKKWFVWYELNLEADSIPLADASVDCVYASHILEHFEKNSVIHFINESIRVLKPWWKLILATPTDYNSFFFAEWTHVRPYNHGSLPELLLDFDFGHVDRMYPRLYRLPKRAQALLRFPLFFLKDIFWREIYARWVKK